jgi:asparagine synthase (glutamine-hydrolysing)
MCGLAGIVDLGAPVEPRDALAMADVLAHRGPDDSGAFAEPGVALAHRRLAIIDLSRDARQPMTDDSGRFVLVYNGEVYNYRELRRQLEAKGVRFSTRSDTEVVLLAFRAWGPDCVTRMRGMWAFAVWDVAARALFCSRDRFGIKPLYYVRHGQRLTFASELKAFARIPGGLRPNVPIVRDFLEQGYLDHTDQTLFAGVAQLPPAHSMSFGANGLRAWRYWSLSPSTPPPDPAREARTRFVESVRLQLRSDVPIGTCLSGGLDSSAIACTVDRLLRTDAASARPIGPRQKTFTSYFEDRGYDERPYARAVAERIGAAAQWISFDDRRLVDVLPRVIQAQDEPFLSMSIVAQWHVMRAAAAAGVKVMLDGQGGDELLAGYDGFFGFRFADLLIAGRWRELAGEVGAYRSVREASAAALAIALVRPFVPRAVEPLARGRALAATNLLHDDLRAAGQHRDGAVTDGARFPDRLRRQLHHVLTRRLPELLHYEDRNSMAHSLEARVPFLDHRLVELMFSLDGRHLIRDGRTKVVFREALDGLVPEVVRDRIDKMGFETPDSRFLRGRLGELAMEVFSSRPCRTRGFVDAGAALRRLQRHRRGEIQAGRELSRALTLELWAQAFLDR